MQIRTVRRISQIFFFVLFIWFCIANTVGSSFWQIRGWPVNLFFYLDPLIAISTIISTHTLYSKLIWAIPVIIATILFGRFFCSWLCPFGALHHFVGYIAHGKKKTSEKIELNKYRKTQNIKYFILIIFLVAAAFPISSQSLQIGLLDPISLFTRSVTLVILPITDSVTTITFPVKRFYEGAWIIFIFFISSVLLNIYIPRFFCRFLCPAGALMGLLSRFAIFRFGQNGNTCHGCRVCEKSCEGGCEPAGKIKQPECVLCFNCSNDCIHNTISYQTQKSAVGEVTATGMSRRAFLTTVGSGVFLIPAVRLSGLSGSNFDHRVIRPPGTIEETEFLKRCLKCGQCMRICPTNVIHPGNLSDGVENLWTPILNFRLGTSGCQYNCVACSQSCPTAALRPISIQEKHGKGTFKKKGPIRIGTAFVDRSRCLPWAKKIPCIVCQENCPVSPKAIYTDDIYETVRDGNQVAEKISGKNITLKYNNLKPDTYSSGDYYVLFNNKRHKIVSNSEKQITTTARMPSDSLSEIIIQIKLQRPLMDIEKCIGCGICEHECPVNGKKAIRVSAEGESRSPDKKLVLR